MYAKPRSQPWAGSTADAQSEAEDVKVSRAAKLGPFFGPDILIGVGRVTRDGTASGNVAELISHSDQLIMIRM